MYANKIKRKRIKNKNIEMKSVKTQGEAGYSGVKSL